MAPTLLTLPPKLRQLIYDYLTITTTLSASEPRTDMIKKHRQGWQPYVQLVRTRDPTLLLICKKNLRRVPTPPRVRQHAHAPGRRLEESRRYFRPSGFGIEGRVSGKVFEEDQAMSHHAQLVQLL